MALLLGLAPAAAGAQSDPTARPAAPNVEVAPVYQSVVEAVWRTSPAFRRQWRRLAADRRIRVVIAPEAKSRDALSEASTEIVRRPDAPFTAFVSLPPNRDLPRLLAHELEHVIEQLDGVELGAHVDTGVVWSGRTSGFETVRAVKAGLRVAREVAAAERNHTEMAGPPEERPVRLVQQETQASPIGPRTSRVSADGRYVVFVSSARLVEADRDTRRDVYVYDRFTGRYTRESGAADGGADGESWTADISGDGRYVVFESEAGNLVRPAFPSGTPHVYLRARDTGETRLLTTDGGGTPVQGWSRNPVISADGTVVAFESVAATLLGPSTGERLPAGVYAIRLADGRRTRVDVDRSGRTDGQGMTPAISADGRLVAFASKGRLVDAAGRAAAAPAIPVSQVYIRDLEANVVTLVSRNRGGSFPDGASFDPAISGDGRFVAFVSEAEDVGAGGRRGRGQVYLHDRTSGSTVLVSRTSRGRPADGPSLRPALSSDGSVIAFQSIASNLDCPSRCSRDERDSNLLWDVFVHDRTTGRTRQATTGADWLAGGRAPSLDAAGRVLALASMHAIDDGDEAYDEDLYVLPARPPAVQVRRLDAPASPGAGVR